MSTPDVLVAGAGPAGSVAAMMLAKAGLRVRLIDRARFPRHKLCGDTINPGSLALLDALAEPDGTVPSPGDRVRRHGLRISGMTVTGPGGTSIIGQYPDGVYGIAITRRDLDAMLLDAAVRAGAVFDDHVRVIEPAFEEGRVTGVRIRGRGRDMRLDARLVIAADGRGSKLASACRLSRFAPRPRRWAFGAYFTDVGQLTSRGEMHIRRGGYIGVAPLPGELANVCVVRSGGTEVRGCDAARLIRDTLDRDPLLRERFADARRVSPVSILGPLAIDSQRPGCPGLLLAGDAAGFVDPMTGDGLRFALRGGMLAARAAFDELTTGAPGCEALSRARRREFAGKWRLNRVLRALVGSPRAVDLAARVAAHWSTPVQYLVGVAGDVALAR